MRTAQTHADGRHRTAVQKSTQRTLRYAGYVYDNATGLYYCSARYYDPTTMQFLTPDSAHADGAYPAMEKRLAFGAGELPRSC